ncbi:alpha/beta fold hydrolase [Corynebacterium doosanense]|uniref:Alpha/beta hydrolase n=1 Tax=Corynebacterium doosanense CAU 212 = DSM 45436 TaxID=558173 RepID=A0A097IF25_9CORY|nr:alpha/beta fold hydrolase [Corynebacterium doosanense]AIT60723.1 alpha/beta hydrolase [Corynebacterium doosanense CAU 212 = DSM 45436]
MSAEVTTSVVEVALPDGSVSALTVHRPADPSARPLIVVWPGLGVGASYYRPLVEELAARGFPAVCGELRGQGENTAHPERSQRWGYHDMAAQDYPLTIRAVKQELGLPEDHPTVLFCHSMGGQIATVFLARPEARELGVVAMYGVGSGSPHYPAFTNPTRNRVRYGSLFMRVVSKVLGYWPGTIAGKDIAGYGRQADPHMAEWSRFSWTNKLDKLSGADMDYPEEQKKIVVPILLTRYNNDDDCPIASCEAMAENLPAADVRIEQFEGDLGHNRWARQPVAVVDRLEAFVGEIGV